MTTSTRCRDVRQCGTRRPALDGAVIRSTLRSGAAYLCSAGAQPRLLACGSILSVLVLALSGCDAREPVAPQPSAEDLRIAQTAEAQPPMFSAFWSVPVPPDNTISNGTIGWTPIPNRVPKPMFTRVRVQGTILTSAHEDYMRYCGATGECPPPLADSIVGPAGFSAWRYLAVSATASLSGWIPFTAVGADAIEAVKWLSPDDVISVSRAGIHGGLECSCYAGEAGCSGGAPACFYTGAYRLEGDQTFTLEELEFRVTPDQSRVPPGDPVRFTAHVDPAVLALPNTRIEWRWAPNDTAAASNPTQLWHLNCAAGSTTCTYAPPGPGRMHIFLGSGRTASEVVRHGNLELRLTCTPDAPVRGQEVTCTASTEPAGANLQVTSWRFTPDSVIVHPKLGYIQMGVPVTEVATDTVWHGPLVLPGRVTVYAQLGTPASPDSTSTTIQISERDWNTGVGPSPPRVDLTWGAPPYSGQPAIFGENLHVTESGQWVSGYRLLGYDFAQPLPAHRLISVNFGPNRGYQYVQTFNIQLNRAYRLNQYITRENPDRDIRTNVGMRNRWEALITLGWGNPDIFFQRAIQHETSGVGRVGHQDGFVQAVSGEVCGNVARRLERIAGSAAEVTQALETTRMAAHEFMIVGAGHHRVYGHMQGALLVVRRPNNPQPLEYSHFDRQASLETVLGGPPAWRHICEYEGWGI